MLSVTQKMRNYEYAPGIATYGMEGIAGDSGQNGNNIFYTNFDIVTEIADFAKQLVNNYLPTKNSLVLNPRPYQDGDFFFGIDGTVYKLKSISQLMEDQESIGTYDKYFTLVARISVKDTSHYVGIIGGGTRLELNTQYGGFDVNCAANGVVDTETAVNVISDDIDGYDRINLVRLVAIDDNANISSKLGIYYDTADGAFHITGDGTPILVDGDMKIANNVVSTDIDGYSSVMTSNNTIMSWKETVSHMDYGLTETAIDPSTNKVTLDVNVDFTDDHYGMEQKFIGMKNSIFFKIYIGNMVYCHRLSDMTETYVPGSHVYGYSKDLNSYITAASDIVMVSAIYNTEVFMEKR